MKILMFDYEYPPLGGGGGVVHALIAEELAKVHEVWVVTSMWADLPRRETRNGVRIWRVPVLGRTERSVASLRSMLTYPPGAWWAGATLLRRHNFDIINSHFAVPTGPGSLPVARIAGIPHVLSIHGGDIFNPASRFSPHRLPLVRGYVRHVLKRSDVVVAQSSNTQSNARRYYNYDGPIEIIPLGIRVPTVPSACRGELQLSEDAFIAVVIGRLTPRKAIDRLITALARPECRGVTLVVVGEGPERTQLETLADSLSVGDRVLFHGRVTETRKWQLLGNADVYVSASRHEGFGLVYLEAMAAGLPIVCTDFGGQTDFLTDGETGFMVSEGDEAALAAAIGRMAGEPDTARAIGQRNLRLSSRFTAERCAADYEALFERTLDGQPPSTQAGDH